MCRLQLYELVGSRRCIERLIPVLIFCLFHMSMNQSIDEAEVGWWRLVLKGVKHLLGKEWIGRSTARRCGCREMLDWCDAMRYMYAHRKKSNIWTCWFRTVRGGILQLQVKLFSSTLASGESRDPCHEPQPNTAKKRHTCAGRDLYHLCGAVQAKTPK